MSDEYIVMKNYCPCKSYYDTFRSGQSLNNSSIECDSNRTYVCKHILAISLAQLFDKISTEVVSDESFVDILCNTNQHTARMNSLY